MYKELHKIDRNTITHIKFHPKTEGIQYAPNFFTEYRWKSQRNSRIFPKLIIGMEGFYLEDTSKLAKEHYTRQEYYDIESECFVKDGSIWTKARFDLYSNDKLVHTHHIENGDQKEYERVLYIFRDFIDF